MPVSATQDKSRRQFELQNDWFASSSPYIYRFRSSPKSSTSSKSERDPKRPGEPNEPTRSADARLQQLESELATRTPPQLRDHLKSVAPSANKRDTQRPPPPLAAPAIATEDRAPPGTCWDFLARAFSRLVTPKAKADRKTVKKTALEQPSKPSPADDRSAEPVEVHSATEDELVHTQAMKIAEPTSITSEEKVALLNRKRSTRTCQQATVASAPPEPPSPGTAHASFSPLDMVDRLRGLASPKARRARREREWIDATLSAPAVSTDRCEHSLQLNPPHSIHVAETEMERGERRLRGVSAFIVRRMRRKSRTGVAERLPGKRLTNSLERHEHRRHQLRPLIERTSTTINMALDRSATSPRLHFFVAPKTIPEVR